MKNTAATIIWIVLVLTGIYFFVYKKDNSNTININYTNPTPGFFDKSSVSQNDILVSITVEGFQPSSITIKKGQKVTWINNTSGLSWPASNPHPSHTDYPGFDTELPMKSGQAWSFTFTKVGDWGYHDHLSPTTRRGDVRVTE